MNNLELQKKNLENNHYLKRFSLQGKVVKKVLEKTITVLVTRKFRHPIYQKTIFNTKKYLVHDPKNLAKVGDFVKIVATRQISKRKHFYLKEILTSGNIISEKKQTLNEQPTLTNVSKSTLFTEEKINDPERK